MKRTLIALSLVVLLAGCSAPAPTETPTPGIPSAAPSPSATPTEPPVALPAPTKMQEQLPETTSHEFSSSVGPQSPTFFEDSRPEASAGTWAVSVACASATGESIALSLTVGDTVQAFEAPCGQANSTITSDGPTFTTTGPYRVDATSEVDAVFALGFTAVV